MKQCIDVSSELQQTQNQIGVIIISNPFKSGLEQYFKTFDCDYVYIVQCHAMLRKYMY